MALDVLELAGLRAQAEWSMLGKRGDGPMWLRAWRQRHRWDARWEKRYDDLIQRQNAAYDLTPLIKTARRAWGVGFLRKAPTGVPSPDEVTAQLQAQENTAAMQEGAMAIYLSLAGQEGEDSGQSTLDALGINKTFTWAGVRDFPDQVFAVRGSKIIQNYYGNHRARLASLVIAKCNPARPKTMGELTKEIRAEWSALTRKEAERIARTESAFVWETTNWNAMTLNSVREVEWLIASGPSIGPPKSFEVCERCVEKAAHSPYVMDDLDEIAPLHPYCRCTTIPKFDPDWLPPAEPWTGAAHHMEVFT